MPDAAAILARGLRRDFGSFVAVRDLDLDDLAFDAADTV
jgi:hypothetical protein